MLLKMEIGVDLNEIMTDNKSRQKEHAAPIKCHERRDVGKEPVYLMW